MNHEWVTRRCWLSVMGATATGAMFRPLIAGSGDPPTSPVAIAKCQSYGPEVLPAMTTIFDQLGGLDKLVAGKTVAIKINMVGSPYDRLNGLAPELTHWTHPSVIAAAIALIGGAGARRIRVLECCGDSLDPFESFVSAAGWNPRDLTGAAAHVEMENTNGLGSGSSYSRITCPRGGLAFPGFDVNNSYVDCDVMVSLAKLKQHAWFGVTLSMKNMYGMTPMTIYGDNAGVDAPGMEIQGTRVRIMHNGERGPSLTAPQEVDPGSSRYAGYRLPRIINDVVSARPIDLAIIDGIQSMAGGEGPWYSNVRPVSPGVLLAGYNPVCTDAVATAAMGFDPMAPGGSAPFELSDSFLAIAAQLGLGTPDLNRIEVRGASIEDACFDFRTSRYGTNRAIGRFNCPAARIKRRR